ncbi:MAG: 2-oxoglutarate ferredoxin oxidoreductase subunit gamma [Chloroflexota bacterium]|nr:2-oxoacid:ferredoxin oxidoreductase subunit gamma [Chloroflexota bacterium]NOG65756.1 2-oxoacid:acceptor oxidoreductase family protein [Chloroflexota bacterium]GIK67070.1 MAG: 2-oxoglutarate ferredoxin oxidoreductase subunit gamma [Chloroflexota bacterium]
MQTEFIFAGFGGQGIMFAGQVLAYAGMDAGLESTWIPSYGPEMRGGTAHCCVVLADRPIGSPVVRNPQVAVVFNNPSFEKYESNVTTGGLLVYNSSLITLSPTRDTVEFLPVPASAIADELGSMRLTNMVMLGAAISSRPVLDLEDIKHALEEHLPAHRRDLLQANFKALERGMECAVKPVLTR